MKRIISCVIVCSLLTFATIYSGCSGKGSEETNTPVSSSFDTRLLGITEISQDVYCESTPMASRPSHPSHPSHCRKGTTSFVISSDGTFMMSGLYGILNEDEITLINDLLAGISLDVEEVCTPASNLNDSAVLAVKRSEQPIRLLLEDETRGDVCVRGNPESVAALHKTMIDLIVKYDEFNDEVTTPPRPQPTVAPTPPPTNTSPRPTAAPSPRNPRPTPRPNPTVTPHPSPRTSPSPRASATPHRPSPQPSASPRPTARPSATPRSTPRPTATPRPRPTARPSATPRPRVTPHPSSTPRSSATPRPSSTPSNDGDSEND